MKNKGFTLVELLGVITILGILALVSFSALDSINKNDKKKAYDAQVNGILESAISYIPTSDIILPELNATAKCITLKELHQAGVLAEKIENAKTGDSFNMDTTKVCVRKVDSTSKVNVEKTLEEGSFAYDGNYIYYLEGV